MNELNQRKLWNAHMQAYTKRSGLCSSVARRWIEAMILVNQGIIAELEEDRLSCLGNEPVIEPVLEPSVDYISFPVVDLSRIEWEMGQ